MAVDRDNWRNDLLARFSKEPVWLGIECGEGWRDLICDLFDTLDRTGTPYEIAQIKQKWGALRIYLECDDGERHIFQALLDEAEIKSETVCENCGRPGEWLKRPIGVRCDRCRNVFSVRRMQ